MPSGLVIFIENNEHYWHNDGKKFKAVSQMLPTTPSSHHVRWRPELETLPEELEEVDLAESLYDISLDTHSEIDVVRLLAQAHPNPELKEYYKQKFRLLHLSELDEI